MLHKYSAYNTITNTSTLYYLCYIRHIMLAIQYYTICVDYAVKVKIVAHSIGGIIARTAPILSNHPFPCRVSDIILLSSPTQR